MNRLLRILRIVVSFFCFAVLTCCLTAVTLFIPVVGPWLESIQLVQAIIDLNLVIFISWILITLIFGRVYCSSVCPLGTLQDIAGRSVRLTRRMSERHRYRPQPVNNWVRYGFMAALILCLIGGWILIPSIIDPYSAFNRICFGFFNPILHFVANNLANVGIESPPAAIYLTTSIVSTIISTLLFALVVAIPIVRGRAICNTVCPVGAMLGIVSRYSIFQMDIDTDLCTQCRRCVDACKAGCINIEDHTVDGSRCVVCFDCTNVCPNNAIRYTTTRKRLSIPMMQRTAAGPSATAEASSPESAPSNAPTEFSPEHQPDNTESK